MIRKPEETGISERSFKGPRRRLAHGRPERAATAGRPGRVRMLAGRWPGPMVPRPRPGGGPSPRHRPVARRADVASAIVTTRRAAADEILAVAEFEEWDG